MRFFADGPNVPNDLLESRDEGEVIFLCGAGISIPAGLPNFQKLAQQVIEELGVPQNAESQRLLKLALEPPDPALVPPMDQVFAHLQREYGVSAVEQAVMRKLKRPRNAVLKYHKAILQLSSSRNGMPRVVTTNFDLLFEAASGRLRHYKPPALPMLAAGRSFDGIVYLHGRLSPNQRPQAQPQGMVLSVADFGRAYLSQGWATTFVQQLLERYTIVLLGYRADDPPMRYLLEGLRADDGVSERNIYAFSEGDAAEVDAMWHERGVKGISYPASTNHSALWESLFAWAERASNPDAWRKNIVDLARTGPTRLAPHERGQVAALCQSVAGAHEFAEADPPPPAEWLCTFDSWVRYTNPGRTIGETETPDFDPLEHYGLDDDPPRPTESRDVAAPGLNILRPLFGEERAPNRLDISGPFSSQAADLPPRLRRLSWWIGKVSDQPAALWWASGTGGLHHHLRSDIEHWLRRAERQCSQVILRGWQLLFEALDDSDTHKTRRDWYALSDRVKKEGWTSANLRAFERVVQPTLKVARPRYGEPRPPDGQPEELRLGQLCQVEIVFPNHPNANGQFADDVLATIVKIVRQGLERGANLLMDMGGRYRTTPTLIQEDKPGESHYLDDDAYFLWFASLFKRLCELNAKKARQDFIAWPIGEQIFFQKLRILVCMMPKIVGPDEAGSILLKVPDESFWDWDVRRELLWALRARWSEFTRKSRSSLEARLVQGPLQSKGEDNEAYSRRHATNAAMSLEWMKRAGLNLSKQSLTKLERLRKEIPEWRDTQADQADESMEGRGGSIRIDADPKELLNAHVADVVEIAIRTSESV